MKINFKELSDSKTLPFTELNFSNEDYFKYRDVIYKVIKWNWDSSLASILRLDTLSFLYLSKSLIGSVLKIEPTEINIEVKY